MEWIKIRHKGQNMSQLYIVLNDQIAISAFWVLTEGSIANPFQKKMSLCFLN